MTNWNMMGGLADCYNPAESQTEYRIQLDCPGAAHTKGSYSEIVSSLPYDVSGLVACSVAEYYGNSGFLWDIAIGAASSEIDIVSNLNHQVKSASWFEGKYHYVPIAIKAGTRVSARTQSENTSASHWLKIGVHFLRKGFNFRSNQISDTYGADTTNTYGTPIDPGAVANTKGSWIEITSGLTRTINGFWLDIGNLRDFARASCYWAFDIGVGSSGNEEPIIKDFLVSLWASNYMVRPMSTPFFPISIPANTRITARAKCTITTAGDRNFDLIMHTVS